MKFYSTQMKSPTVGLGQAVMNGLAPDGGLYMPFRIPRLPNGFFKKANSMSFQDIAFEVSKNFFIPDLPKSILVNIVQEAFNFSIPLVELDKQLYVLELFHGPTCAFKDFAARFMARILGFFAEKLQQEITIIVATSGDTGSAVAHGFLNVKGIKVVILYPSGKVSSLQEKQLTSMGENITALEVRGTFDDCQKLAKQAFVDGELKEKMTLASANSINIARLLPQSFYYVYLSAQLSMKGVPIAVSVPSGNFGNLTAGIIAKRMGAPIAKFIASTNSNDVVPRYLKTGTFQPKPSVSTISNAMDVGNPSNFSRMLELYENDVRKMRDDIHGVSFSDVATREALLSVFKKYQYTMDTHGAVAYLGLVDFMKKFKGYAGVFLETAHPSKFFEEVEKVIGVPVSIPDRLKEYLDREKQAILLSNDFSEFKSFLLKL
ncbi:MAG: threonine synthase [Candidatus Spechtbacteria bacterium RIFCSPLOWO2_12_FULL_38_22]|uniref:Threonine synthase n=1 Tax=Candidatus Spechtbacteria bacterium RIFCSPLOWO2_12_FULL_38_22 TaxID=1802165 RepID=A0A1G2HGA5_9BACT|nr:MAG: threonine synthase [Candidatus Spechtbacteria bacterium RIFCSPHIGHO2_12_FULL_38_30]OGZ60521.1 MAG: threonine synthase [Candidatus Spechtbacteria bacterium RIFCSPLOWO2_01_FULL_38_20]OGZ61483.1 MAG: threonine synthase [Candidatus Spechtbacteria bacterium RIFCSPLOWO2_12_FULL_38_22]